MFKSLFAISLVFFSASFCQADSLWTTGSTSMFVTPKNSTKVGDIITIRISESTTALQEATTKTQKQSELDAQLLSNWDQVANILGSESIRKGYELDIKGNDSYNGTGQTSRRSRVSATITAIVTEVLDTGIFYIVGEHKVKVNDEVETIRISGFVRPEDVKPDNSIASSQIAKAEVSVIGAGVVGSKQTPGILTKMFNWFF
ncbi:MAG: flagellar basal body L-ring protein FlgH [Candidatus Margulisiibacteriota bacterium]